MDNKSELSKPVAEVVSKFGDPEAFGEREIKLLTGIQKMAYGTKFYSQEYVSALDKVAQFWIGESAGWKKRAEAAEQKLATSNSEWFQLFPMASPRVVAMMNVDLQNALAKRDKRITELEAKLATPVRLPRTLWYEHDDLAHEIPVLEKKKVVAEIRAAGFKVEGDER